MKEPREQERALDVVQRAMDQATVQEIDGVCGTVRLEMPLEAYGALKELAKRLEGGER